MIVKTTAVSVGALALALTAAVSARHRLHPPFPAASAPLAASDGGGAACPPAPPAVRSIDTVSKYGANRRENDSTVVDASAAARYEADTRPVTDFTHEISKLSDAAIEHRRTASDDAACALGWMDRWASQGALLGSMSQQGEAVRKWELATLATSYLKIRDIPHDSAADARVRQWLDRLGKAVQADYSRGTDKDSRRNNHLYWAAWAAMATGIATDDRALFDWSIDRYRFALSQIAADGTLPLELQRRQLALSYHAFALGPLVMLHEGALANGVTLSADDEQRLQRLVDRTIAGVGDPAWFNQHSGYPQDLDKVTNTQLAWLEAWYARSRDPRALALIAPRRPLTAPRLGGNLTALFAAGALPLHRPAD